MISGIRWTLKTVAAAAEAELNDDAVLRERLMEAEMQREMGEISDDEFAAIEEDLLLAIRQIKERREGGSGPFAVSAGEPIDTGEGRSFHVEAEVAGEFYGEPGGSDRSIRSSRSTRSSRSDRSDPGDSSPSQTARTVRTSRTSRTSRTIRTSRTDRTARPK